MEKKQTSKQSKKAIQTFEPQMFSVIIHNDDFTTMDFVVMILRVVFFKREKESEALMLKVHREGQAVVGHYPLDIAESKVKKAVGMARALGFPLVLTIEPSN